jgi:hypothetical protein
MDPAFVRIDAADEVPVVLVVEQLDLVAAEPL